MSARIQAIYLSVDHNYFGHHGKPSGKAPMLEAEGARCVAGKGIEGDRFFGWKPDYKGQITFFCHEVYEELCQKLEVSGRDPSVFRRNVVTCGIDLNSLIGQRFRFQGILFEGTEEASPCYWMEEAFGEGAEEAMKGNGGLRARILEDGVLRVGPADLEDLGPANIES